MSVYNSDCLKWHSPQPIPTKINEIKMCALVRCSISSYHAEMAGIHRNCVGIYWPVGEDAASKLKTKRIHGPKPSPDTKALKYN